MKITNDKIKSLNPCLEGWQWYLGNCREETDLKYLLYKINDYRPDWARWLFTELMDRRQCIEISIFAAINVLNIYEEKYPDDHRPRKAIEAAEKYLKIPTEENRRAAAAAAATAAYDAAAYATYADTAAAAAAYAAATTATAAYATYDYTAAATYADTAAADKKQLQEKIIDKAVEILEGDAR